MEAGEGKGERGVAVLGARKVGLGEVARQPKLDVLEALGGKRAAMSSCWLCACLPEPKAD